MVLWGAALGPAESDQQRFGRLDLSGLPEALSHRSTLIGLHDMTRFASSSRSPGIVVALCLPSIDFATGFGQYTTRAALEAVGNGQQTAGAFPDGSLARMLHSQQGACASGL